MLLCNEFLEICKRMNLFLSHEEALGLFSNADTGNNGRIDYDEFENCLHMLERALVFRVMETLGVEPGQARDVCCFCMPAQRGVRGAGSVTSAHVAAGEPRHTLM